MTLDGDATRNLVNLLPRALNTQLNHALLAALAATLCNWIGSRTLLLHVEGHGREMLPGNLDVTRTVGWFTSVYPLWLSLPADESPGRIKFGPDGLGRDRRPFRLGVHGV